MTGSKGRSPLIDYRLFSAFLHEAKRDKCQIKSELIHFNIDTLRRQQAVGTAQVLSDVATTLLVTPQISFKSTQNGSVHRIPSPLAVCVVFVPSPLVAVFSSLAPLAITSPIFRFDLHKLREFMRPRNEVSELRYGEWRAEVERLSRDNMRAVMEGDRPRWRPRKPSTGPTWRCTERSNAEY